MNPAGFDEYLERLLVELAGRQSTQVMSHDIQEIHRTHFPDCPETWAIMAARAMSQRGWGVDGEPKGRRGHFWIEGAGLSAAQHLREKYRPKTAIDFFRSFSRSDWIAIGAFVVSLIALFKD